MQGTYRRRRPVVVLHSENSTHANIYCFGRAQLRKQTNKQKTKLLFYEGLLDRTPQQIFPLEIKKYQR